MRLLAATLIGAAVATVVACGSPAPSAAGERRPGATPAARSAEERLELEVVATYPHDPAAFTQGLLWHQGKLYESTGMYGRSSLREVEIASGRVLRRVELADELFAEGLALAGDRLFQLSYQNEIAWEWEFPSFTRRREI